MSTPPLGQFFERDWQRADSGAIRYAIIGLGSFATEQVLPSIQESEISTNSVLVSGSRDKASRLAKTYNGQALTYDEFHDGQEKESYEAVYIATPNKRHLDFIETAAANGKHILCEKPLEGTTERAEKAVTICKDAGVNLMTAYRMQTHPMLRELRRLISNGFFGQPVQIHSTFSIVMDELDSWRLDSEQGGGALFDLGIYSVNTLRFLLESNPTAVFGSTYSETAGFEDVDEHISFEMTFPGGISAMCTASFNGFRDDKLVLTGTDGKLLFESPYDDLAPRSLTLEIDGERYEISDEETNEIREEFDYFSSCILKEGTPEPDGEDGLTDMRIMAAIYESAASETRVAL